MMDETFGQFLEDELEGSLWPYDQGEYELDPCNYREGWEESWDEEHFEDGPYQDYEEDDQF